MMKIAIPTEKPGGLTARRSDHFGHCPVFTLVECSDGSVIGVEVIDNAGHGEGGCLEPVELLRQAGVTALVAAGVGARPMQGLSAAGITVYYADTVRVPDAQAAADKLTNGGLPVMRPSQACQGSGTCGH